MIPFNLHLHLADLRPPAMGEGRAKGFRSRLLNRLSKSFKKMGTGEQAPSIPWYTKPALPFSFMPNNLNVLPPELREQIFIPCLEWNGKTPALIVAARSNWLLHGEVMDIFRRLQNTFVFHRGNNWSTGDMSFRTTNSIRKLKLVGEQHDSKKLRDFILRVDLSIPWNPRLHPEVYFCNVREIAICAASFPVSAKSPIRLLDPNCPPPRQPRSAAQLNISQFWSFLIWFPSLKKITLGIPVGVNHATTCSGMNRMIEEANFVLGLSGKLTRVFDFSIEEWWTPDEWVWDAGKEGEFAWKLGPLNYHSSNGMIDDEPAFNTLPVGGTNSTPSFTPIANSNGPMSQADAPTMLASPAQQFTSYGSPLPITPTTNSTSQMAGSFT